jgi:hypothetical protein
MAAAKARDKSSVLLAKAARAATPAACCAGATLTMIKNED